MTLSRSLTRDLTLSSEAPLAFCLRLFLQSLQWTGQSSDFASVMGRDPRSLDLVDARNVLLRLGYNTRLLQINDFNDLKTTLLPALYVSPDDQPFVLQNGPDEGLQVVNASGVFPLDAIAPGGWILVLDDTELNQRSSFIEILLLRFSTKIRTLYLISFAIALLSLALPFYIRAVYNIAIPARSLSSTFWLLIGGAFVFTLDLNLRQWRVKLLSNLGGRLDVLFGLKLLQKFLGLDFRQLEMMGYGGFSSRSRNLESILAYAQGPLALALLDSPFVFLYLLAIWWLGGALVLVPLVIMVLSGVLIAFLSRYYSSAQELNITTGISLFQAQQELVRRFLEVRLSNLEWVWFQRLRGLSGQSTSTSLTINEQVGRLQVISSTASQLAGVITLGVGCWFAFQSQDPKVYGNLIAAMFLVWRVFTPFQYFMSALLRFEAVRRQYDQFDQFMRLKTGDRPTNLSTYEGFRFSGYIELTAVSCRLAYDSSLQLTRCSMRATPGEILALTGKSGSGKSVALRVIDQLYPVSSGSLLFDGKDHRQFSADAIQRNIAYVLPSPQFLPGTIWDNLVAMNPDARFEDVQRVCDQLELSAFIASFPDGYESIIDHQALYQIPIGIRRLLSLAQALIKDAPILLIDDITQGLTPDQFEVVAKVVPTLSQSHFTHQKRTVILSTDNAMLLDLADRICILDKGVTAFEGTQDELKQSLQKTSAMPG